MIRRIFSSCRSIWLQMQWEWFATAKATSQVSFSTCGWFRLVLMSQILVTQACCYSYPYIVSYLLPSAAAFWYCTYTWVCWSVSKQPFPDSLLFFIIQSVLLLYRCLCQMCVFLSLALCEWCSVCFLGNEVIGVDSAEVRASVQSLHIIDNQQTLFELSHKLEPRA